MKKTFLPVLSAALLLMIGCSSPEGNSSENLPQVKVQEYDEMLAKELGADDYGMRQYVIAFLKAGPNQSQDSTRAAELQRAHLDNIRRLAEEGKLVLAGPFMDNGDMRGLYVFDVKTVEEARDLTATDPAVEAGRLVMELRPWYGSAALTKVNDIHSRISKTNP